FFFQAEDGIRDFHVTGVQTCALPISGGVVPARGAEPRRDDELVAAHEQGEAASDGAPRRGAHREVRRRAPASATSRSPPSSALESGRASWRETGKGEGRAGVVAEKLA